MIGIVTAIGDIHAHAVAHALQATGTLDCHIIELDYLSFHGQFSWQDSGHCIVCDHLGTLIDTTQLRVIWWRRFHLDQRPTPFPLSDIEQDVVNNDCRAAIFGGILSASQATWISDPNRQRTAENKIIQLAAARRVGFSVPETIVSNDPDTVRQFCAKNDGNCIVKPLSGTRKHHLFTRPVGADHLNNPDSIRLSPAIYQARIAGTDHLRVHVFGETIVPIRISSEILDWREELLGDFSLSTIPKELAEKCLQINKLLGLRMSIFDFKIDETGVPHFLELNPQGQFLFSQGMSDVDLLSPFVDFLRETARNEA